ncbi:hypothetical protein MTO96_015521 [Rhipicephalus appendiculatus]
MLKKKKTRRVFASKPVPRHHVYRRLPATRRRAIPTTKIYLKCGPLKGVHCFMLVTNDTVAVTAFILATVLIVLRRSLRKMVILCIIFPSMPMLTLVAINSLRPGAELLLSLVVISTISFMRRKFFYN